MGENVHQLRKDDRCKMKTKKVWGRLSAMSPVDRAHTTSHWSVIVTIYVYFVPFSRRSDLFVEIRAVGDPVGGDIVAMSPTFGHEKDKSHVVVCDRFSHLCDTPTCDRRTNRRTERQTRTQHSTHRASIFTSRGKNPKFINDCDYAPEARRTQPVVVHDVVSPVIFMSSIPIKLQLYISCVAQDQLFTRLQALLCNVPTR